MAARNYRQLICWQLADELKKEAFAFTATAPAIHDRDFCQDIRASTRSARANIAEGFARETHRDFANFLAIARASLVETDNHLLDARDSKYIDESYYLKPTRLANGALATTTSLQSYLLRTPDYRTRGRPTIRRPR